MTKMSEFKATDMAASLYDGGWKAEDHDDLMIEYDLTAEQADQICELLKEYEEADRK